MPMLRFSRASDNVIVESLRQAPIAGAETRAPTSMATEQVMSVHAPA